MVGDDSPSFVSSLKTQSTTALSLLPASPDCWLEAMQVLRMRHKSILLGEDTFPSVHSYGNDSRDQIINTMTCRWMTPDDQKVLALELSKCHMEDIGRPLFQFQDEDQHNSCSRVVKEYNVITPEGNIDTNTDDGSIFHRGHHQQEQHLSIASNCLVHLTDTGVSTYTHFFSYVNELCIRLLSETTLGLYRQTSHQLAKSSKIAESKIQALIEQQDILFDRWKDESRIRIDEYKRHQETLANEMEKYRVEFTIFGTVTRKARKLKQSWSYGLDSVINGLKAVHCLFQGIVYNVCGILLSYFLTIPISFRWMRFYMFATIMISSSVEIWIAWAGTYDDEETPWIFAYIESCDFLCTNCSYAICNFYLIGIFLSLFFGCGRPGGQSDYGGEELLGSNGEKPNNNIIVEHDAIHEEQQHGKAENSFFPERSVQPNYVFTPFSSPRATTYSNEIFATPGARATTGYRLNSDSINHQQQWDQQSYWLMRYMIIPPPPIGSRACPIIIESNDENACSSSG
eukprot:jgi/Psemu1/199478/e_gw1.238.35.1